MTQQIVTSDSIEDSITALNANRILCVYENQPLTTESTFAVPRIASQLLEQLALRHPGTENIAVSPTAGDIPNV